MGSGDAVRREDGLRDGDNRGSSGEVGDMGRGWRSWIAE